MRAETKDRIASRFLEWPVLHMLVRSLLFSIWFRLFFFGFLLLPLILAATLTKIWRVTPADFRPVVRISVLDWLQARSLEHTAIRELRAGKIKEGLTSYNMAFANHPGDVRIVRTILREIQQKVEPPEFQMTALQRAFWLLRLTKTNLVDLELAVGVFQKYGLDQYLLSLLMPQQERLTPALRKSVLLALFNNDRMSEFDHWWHSLDSHPDIRSDPEVRLCRAAFNGIWGTASARGNSDLRLEDHLIESPWRVLANRLYLQVCERRLDAEGYGAALQRLQDWREARLTDHIRGWRLLAANRQKDEAVKLAEAYPGTPATGLETVQLAQAYSALGLPDRAARLLDRSIIEFRFLDGLWALYGNLLLETGRWDELRQLALRMRLDADVRERLGAFSCYLEGRVELAQHRPGLAAQLFAQISAKRMENLDLALFVARGLCELGHASVARAFLLPLEPAGRQNPAYWESLVAVAYALKDEALLVRAATEAVSLSPTSWPIRNNYAAALLITNRSPGEAVKETYQLFTQFPDNGSIRINHALALLQHHRYSEADKTLAVLHPSTLTESERAVYSVACLETLIAQERFALARRFSAEIDSTLLFPSQQEHLTRLRQKLPNPDGDRAVQAVASH